MSTKRKEMLFIMLVIVGGLYFSIKSGGTSSKDVELSMIIDGEENTSENKDAFGILSVCEKIDSISESPKLEASGLPLVVIFYLHSGKVAGLYAPPEIYMYKDYYYSFQLRRFKGGFFEVLEINPRHCESKKQPKDLQKIIPRVFEDKKVPQNLPGPTPSLAGVFFYPYLWPHFYI